MGQIANQMALELIFKIKERIKEKKEEKKQEKTIKKKNRKSRPIPVSIMHEEKIMLQEIEQYLEKYPQEIVLLFLKIREVVFSIEKIRLKKRCGQSFQAIIAEKNL